MAGTKRSAIRRPHGSRSCGSVTQDIRGQTRQVLAAVDAVLQRAGTDTSRLLGVQIFLADLTDFEGMNEVSDAWLSPGDGPPRATVEARRAKPEWRIEVVVTSAIT